MDNAPHVFQCEHPPCRKVMLVRDELPATCPFCHRSGFWRTVLPSEIAAADRDWLRRQHIDPNLDSTS